MNDGNMKKSPFIMIRKNGSVLFDAIPDLIAILDEEHRVTRVNQAMADTLGDHQNHVLVLSALQQYTVATALLTSVHIQNY